MALHGEELEFNFNLRELTRKGHLTCENRISRRFSASCIRSFREDHKSCTTNFTISSTLSSPGYSLKDEIDPSDYSFTSALKALQAKAMYKKKCDWLKPEGVVELNSKWNEAEKYICNPLSGEVPIECLSSRTLNSRSFRNLSTTHSPPLTILPSNHNPRTVTTPMVRIIHGDSRSPYPVLIQEEKVVGLKRDVGVQSAPATRVGPATTSPIMERSKRRQVEDDDDSPVEYALKKAQQEDLKDVKSEEKEKSMTRKEIEEDDREKETKKKRGSRCFSWMRKMHRQPRKSKCIFHICLPHLINTTC
ncbi:PREDICTED: uncharacterized protein LOC104744327 isoform X2 [Camelina sativa]|uniref:Uncharacterized protein LOC104744327 isoform X2 n=1 Tax=Camelina sativa TaxID=90675 RepID=A0ABM0VZN2_CAMSA|nr:PREDICTED: uncharacterized protein LOC104744327 isoform X2 [Camelina sativa]